MTTMYFYLPAPFLFMRTHIYGRNQPLGRGGCDVDHTDLNTTNPCTEICEYMLSIFLFLAYCYMAIPCRFAPSYPCRMIDR